MRDGQTAKSRSVAS